MTSSGRACAMAGGAASSGPISRPRPSDQALIGRDQGDIGIDPEPAVAREHLDVEMQVAGGAVGMVQIVRHHADFFALLDAASVQDAVGVHARRIHVHVAEADMFVAGVDLQGRRLLFQASGSRTPSRTATTACRLGSQRSAPSLCGRTGRRADVLALMAKPAGTLSDAETAGFAKIVLPGIAGHPLAAPRT